MKVLLVEDEDRLVATMRDGLRTAGIGMDHARTGREGLAAALTGEHDLMILDIGLPDQEGFTVLRRLRAAGSELPVIVLTARTSVEDTVRGLERGADDYMTKPFSFDELIARIRLRVRRPAGEPEESVIQVGRCTWDPTERVLTCDGITVSLSPRELQLARMLIEAQGDVVPRGRVLQEIWGIDGRDNVLDVYVGYLRTRLGSDAIETVRGVGYRFRG